VKIIRKQVVSQSLELLEELARDRKEDYEKFWANFGSVLKEGAYYEPELKTRIAALLRFESSAQPGLSTLDEYVSRMPEGQPAIYYASGTSRHMLEGGPHLEALRARGYEVLFMTEAVDPFVVEALGEYRNKPLLSASTADLKFEGDGKEQAKAEAVLARPVLERFKSVLGERVSEVRASERLTESPACLVTAQGDLPPHLERILRARSMDVPSTRRILEVNLGHPLLRSLNELSEKHPDSPHVGEWIELVYDQALLAEGSPIDDPVRFARRIAELVTHAAESEAAKLRGSAQGAGGP
jgi:molecular chaperone HtpG